MTKRRLDRSVVWLLLALPGIAIVLRWIFTPDTYGYGHALAQSGDWSIWLLMVTLAVTPLRLAFGRHNWVRWVARHRRDLGVASFCYAVAHTVFYLWRKGSISLVINELGELYIVLGWVALILFVPLAATSSDRAVRALKRSWNRLHRLVYPAAVLAFLHWALSAFDPTTAMIHIGIMTAIEVWRVALQRRQRVT